MKHFRFSIFFTVVCFALSTYWGFTHGPEAGVSTMLTALTITAILAVMEVSILTIAVVNALCYFVIGTFLENASILTVGILVAVFGIRLIFPVAIVAVTADMGID